MAKVIIKETKTESGLGGPTKTLERIIEVEQSEYKGKGVTVDKDTPTHDWQEVN